MDEDDAHSYVSLFGQRVSLPVETIGDEGDIPSLKHLSLKETLYEVMLSGLNSHPTIRSLPTEVLMIIFKYLSGSNPKHLPAEHFAHQRKRTGSNGMESAPIQCDCKYTWLKPAVHWRLFPHSQARVCTRWRAILSSSPTIWTRVVVSRVSGDWTHPHELEEYLRWTKGHPIEVYIGNERNQRAELNGFGPNTVSEGDMVAQYTALLKPHLWRCTVIDYHVQYSTSLPSLIHDLTGISEHLESLRLVCDEECPASYKPTKTLPPINAQIRALLSRSYPKLITLAIDGANFILACLYLPELLRAAQDELTIHHYHNDLKVHPHVDNEHFSVHNILAALYPRLYPSLHPHRLLITFRSVEFHHLNGLRYILKNSRGMYKASPPQLADDYGVDWRHIWLKFVNMSDHLLSELTLLADVSDVDTPQNVELDNCTILALDTIPALKAAKQVPIPTSVADPDEYVDLVDCTFETGPIPTPRISLRNIHDIQSIKNFFDRVAGCRQLSVHSSAGFTDEALLQCHGDVDLHHDSLHEHLLTLGIEELEITDCRDFSLQALWTALYAKTATIKHLDILGTADVLHLQSVTVAHPAINLDATSASEWHTRFLGICNRFTWKYVPGGSFTFDHEKGDSDEEMEDVTGDSSNDAAPVDESATIPANLDIPEVDSLGEEARLELDWPFTLESEQRFDEESPWITEGLSTGIGLGSSYPMTLERIQTTASQERIFKDAKLSDSDSKRSDVFLTDGAPSLPLDNFLTSSNSEASTSAYVDDVFDDFVQTGYLDDYMKSD